MKSTKANLPRQAKSRKAAMNHKKYVHLDARAKVAKLFIILNFLLIVASSISQYWNPFPANTVLHGGIEGALVSGAQWSLLLAVLMFFRWYIGAGSNARTLNPSTMKSGAIGAVVLWFVPIANLLLPILLMNETWRASLVEPEDYPKRSRFVVAAWWLAWLYGMAMIMVGAYVHAWSSFYSLPMEITPRSCYGLVSLFASALMICRIITRITNEQDRTFAVRLAEANDTQVRNEIAIAPPEDSAEDGGMIDITSAAVAQTDRLE